MTEIDFQSVLQQLKKSFQPESARNVNAVIQFKLTGAGGGNYLLKIANGQLEGEEGLSDHPRVTLTAAMNDIQGIFDGKIDPMKAYFQGKLAIKGDIGFAMQMARFFKR